MRIMRDDLSISHEFNCFVWICFEYLINRINDANADRCKCNSKPRRYRLPHTDQRDGRTRVGTTYFSTTIDIKRFVLRVL